MAQTFTPNDTRPTCSETLGSFAANLRYEALPAAAIRRLQDHLGHAQPRIEAVELRLTGIDALQAKPSLDRGPAAQPRGIKCED